VSVGDGLAVRLVLLEVADDDEELLIALGSEPVRAPEEKRKPKADPVAKRNPRIPRAQRLSRTVGYVTLYRRPTQGSFSRRVRFL
jgi:hypothetical protein